MKKMSCSKKHAAKVLRCIRKYPGWWYLICMPGAGHMNMAMTGRLIAHLEINELYKLITVFFMVNRNTDYVKCACRHEVLEMTEENWNGNAMGRERLVREIFAAVAVKGGGVGVYDDLAY